eukprot:CAMPEP_0173469696 /NCGR_PEP_ID=MMETSP1357-20121228/77497_1 /TAXON_ID=77926 /ORGANISM="Hemiselmis rufescens, Strain PCC563" /LENGTH=72 /DNA_ID=CAMNT_0014437947 /DNA_START=72 /DNA_END=290 /DNA_ORIENTATION=-
MEVQTIDTNATSVVLEISTTSTEVQTINTSDTETGGPALTTTRTKALHKQVKHLNATLQKLQASQERNSLNL